MKPLRKNVAIAIDGGGIRGVIVTRALSILEEHLGKPIHQVVRLAAGTSTGSIISAGIGFGLNAETLHALYLALGSNIFKKTWRTFLWPLTPYRYSPKPLEDALQALFGEMPMGDFWTQNPPMDVVITAFDVLENRSRFIKPYKEKYRTWPVVQAVLASSSVPTYFPVVAGRYVDGGVGSYANPCFLAAYELAYCLKWDPAETTLLSLGTGHEPPLVKSGQPERFATWDWLWPSLDAFLASADDQQVRLVDTFFKAMDFRRFQVELKEKIELDDPHAIPTLIEYGNEMGRKILHDEYDQALKLKLELPQRGQQQSN